jgi:hypothetical protein
MKKDIYIPNSDGVYILAVPEWNEEQQHWRIFLLNRRPEEISNILVSAGGAGMLNGEERKTAELRYYIKSLKPSFVAPVEMLDESAARLKQTYWITYYSGQDLCELKLHISPEILIEEALEEIPELGQRAVCI